MPTATGESSIAPRTDSSASRFCGGTTALRRSPTRSSSVRLTRRSPARLGTPSRRKEPAGKTSSRPRSDSKASVPHGSGVKPSGAAASNRKGRDDETAPVQGEQNIRSDVIPARGRPVDRSAQVVHPETCAASGNFRPGSTPLWRTVGTPRARYDDAVPATTSGRRRRARPIAPETVRCRPSSRNHGLPRLYAFQSATTRLFRQRRAAFRIRAFTCA